MKSLNQYINESFKFGKNQIQTYSCQPKTNEELREILRKRLEEDKNADLNDIDVSQITNMSQLFVLLYPNDINISGWDVSNVENMSFMFWECHNFNADLSNWDVSSVKNMSNMFTSCNKFEGKGLENWNVSKVEYMRNMFNYCVKIKNKPSWYKE